MNDLNIMSIPDVINTSKGEIIVAGHSYPVWFIEENQSVLILNADNESIMDTLINLDGEKGVFKRNKCIVEDINLPITLCKDSSYSAFKYPIKVSKMR